jgi:hypothetical protein
MNGRLHALCCCQSDCVKRKEQWRHQVSDAVSTQARAVAIKMG